MIRISLDKESVQLLSPGLAPHMSPACDEPIQNTCLSDTKTTTHSGQVTKDRQKGKPRKQNLYRVSWSADHVFVESSFVIGGVQAHIALHTHTRTHTHTHSMQARDWCRDQLPSYTGYLIRDADDVANCGDTSARNKSSKSNTKTYVRISCMRPSSVTDAASRVFQRAS